MMSHRFRAVFALAGLLALVALPVAAQQAVDPATGQPVPPPSYVPPNPVVAQGPAVYATVSLQVGTGKMVTLPQRVASIFAANPAIVDVRPASPSKLFLFAKGVGETTVVATDTAGTTIAQYTVIVNPEVTNSTVQTPAEAYKNYNSVAAAAGGNFIDQSQVAEPIQVELKVRIASMQRTTTRELGIDWSSVGSDGVQIGKFLGGLNTETGSPNISGAVPSTAALEFPGGTFEGIIDALAADNLAHVLAEPTLTTLSGTTANFQVGGEVPVPTAEANNTISISFENYGVILSFTPIVESDGRIVLTVTPQISSLSNANSATLSSSTSSVAISVPSLIITQASSTVVLGSGQGMAIAGLLEDTTNQADNAVPGLGELPVLGALFRGDSFQREQQELVITVTPYLVNPVSNPGALASPDDGWTPPNDLQRILLLRDSGTEGPNTTIPGDAGFMVQ